MHLRRYTRREPSFQLCPIRPRRSWGMVNDKDLVPRSGFEIEIAGLVSLLLHTQPFAGWAEDVASA